MRTQQLGLFSSGGDTPLFSGTPPRAKFETFEPREAKSPPRFFVCPACQAKRKVKRRSKCKATVDCQCAANHAAQSRALLERLPVSKKTQQRRKQPAGDNAYAECHATEPGNESRQVLREALQMDNPALRLTTQGPQALTLIELLSFVLGTPNDPVAASHLLSQLKNPTAIKVCSVRELALLGHGMTVDRARRLLAALELADRLRLPREERPVIKAPADVANLLSDMSTLEQEQLRVVLLDTKSKVIHTATVYQGSVHTTVIQVGELLKAAVRLNAPAMVIAHNHPSGDPTPSPEDIAVTREIVQAAKLLDIDCFDHVVIGEAGKFVSLKERGLGF
jgi:DNA repair protein RadC